jgi:hypothetical protein
LNFTVGPKKASFNIHEALLQLKTDFFTIHPEPNGESRDAQSKEPETEPTFKTESSPSDDADNPEGPVDDPTTPATTTDQNEAEAIKVDYHLDTQYVKAFAIFVDWLYNTPPQPPKSAAQCKILIQAYLLALKYRALGLQNLLLNCIRKWHTENSVNFDFFIYLLNRHEDDVSCKLIMYFVDQIAYEMADTGVKAFDSSNSNLEYFLRDRSQGKVRTALFHALGNIAQAGKNGDEIVDPAIAKMHDYYV